MSNTKDGLSVAKYALHTVSAETAESLAQPPYGYMKSPDNKKKWIIEPEAAAVIRDIFRICMEGKGNETIAYILSDRKVMTPTAYWRERGINCGGKKVQPDPYKWKNSTVRKILANQEYCGDIINFKTYSMSFKNKARLENAKDNWVVFKDIHEPH